jgi:molecular chaperone DnaK
VVEGGEPLVIESAEGTRTTPSVVAITRNEERLVGPVARRQAITNPDNTVFSIKRLMGRKLEDPEVQRARALVPYRIVSARNGDACVRLAGADYAPQQISAMILAKIKADVEARLGAEVTQAVITVPAYFNDAQRQATRDAGRIAGLEVLRIINEPTAAALAYGLDRKGEETIAVYDLGGGTFDISILQLSDGLFEVKSTNGDTHLGGDDFDARIIDWLVQGFNAEHGIDLRADRLALQRLKEAAEKAKIELSSLLHADINLPFIAAGPQGPLHLSATLTRAKFEGLAADLIEATAAPCRRALADADLTPQDIDAVILVGGQTRMPAVQALVRDLFGREPSKAVNPDEVVAAGAAVQGAALAGEMRDVLLLDVTPLTLGVETQGGGIAALIPRNTTVPATRSEIFTTAIDGQDSVEVHVTQGERPLARDNKSLARFHLDGIPPAPRGVPQIEVSFTLDANGILQVSARDCALGRTQHVTVAPSSGLSEADLDRMVQEASRHRDRDRGRQAVIALRNEADALLNKAKRVVREVGERLGETQREELALLTAALDVSLPTGDMPQIRERMKLLDQALKGAAASLH